MSLLGIVKGTEDNPIVQGHAPLFACMNLNLSDENDFHPHSADLSSVNVWFSVRHLEI
jgi:hypothetical protein